MSMAAADHQVIKSAKRQLSCQPRAQPVSFQIRMHHKMTSVNRPSDEQRLEECSPCQPMGALWGPCC